jgi:hypothetical protein
MFFDARAFVLGDASYAAGQAGPTVQAANAEMPPAAVERHIERRVGGLDHLDDIVGGGV